MRVGCARSAFEALTSPSSLPCPSLLPACPTLDLSATGEELPRMFSPMSSGRDKWDEASSSGSPSSHSSAGPSSLPNLKRVSGDAKTKGKGKGVISSGTGPSGRVLSPNVRVKGSLLAFPQLRGAEGGEERRLRRNHYASPSRDGEGEREALLGSSTGRSKGRSNVPLWKDAFRPSKKTVDRWMESWTVRWTILAVIPSVIVSGEYSIHQIRWLICNERRSGMDLVCNAVPEVALQR